MAAVTTAARGLDGGEGQCPDLGDLRLQMHRHQQARFKALHGALPR